MMDARMRATLYRRSDGAHVNVAPVMSKGRMAARLLVSW